MKTPAQVKNIQRHKKVEEYLDEKFDESLMENSDINIYIPDEWDYDDLAIADEYLKMYGWDNKLNSGSLYGEEESTLLRSLTIFPISSKNDIMVEAALVSQLSENIEIVNKNRIKIEANSPDPYGDEEISYLSGNSLDGSRIKKGEENA
jgi:hypothetical protein